MLDGKEWICSDHVVIGNDLYFVAGIDLIRVDMMSWDAHYITGVKNVEWIKKHGVVYITAIDETIFLIGWDALSIAMYDLAANIIEPIYEEKDGTTSIFNIELWDNQVFLFPKKTDEVIVLDKNGGIKKHLFVLKEDKLFMRSCRVGDEVWFIPKEGKKYYRFLLSEKKISVNELPFQLINCINVRAYNNQVYFLDDDTIRVWNGADQYKNIKIKDVLFAEKSFGILIPLKERIYILPRRGDDILEVSYDGTVRTYQEYPDGYCCTQSKSWLDVGAKYLFYDSKDGIYYFPRRATNYMLSIDSRSEKIDWISIKKPDIEEMIKYELEKNGGVIREKEGYLSVCLKSLLLGRK